MTDPASPDALEIARAAFQALEAHDWERLRALVDPAALEEIKQQAVAVVEMAPLRRPSTPEEIQAGRPGMPRDVAEWFADEERRALESEDPAGLDSLGVALVDELMALDPGDVFVRWMAATEMTGRLQRLTGRPHVISLQYEVLGVVMEGDSIAHAVYRVSGFARGAHIESLKRTDAGWRLSQNGILSRSLRTHVRVSPRVDP